MLRRLLRRFGAIRIMLAVTVISVTGSVLIALLLNFFLTGEPMGSGLAIAFLVPAGITPLLSYHNLKLLEQLDKAEDQLKILSITDDLTQIYNRRYFLELANQEFEKARRYRQRFAIAILDLDNFKQVNDGYGHLAGNHVLKELSRLLKDHIRSSDSMARYGGDEFIFLLPNTDRINVMEGAERIQHVLLSNPIPYQQDIFQLQASIGIALFDRADVNLDDILKRADEALYQVKHSEGIPVKLAEMAGGGYLFPQFSEGANPHSLGPDAVRYTPGQKRSQVLDFHNLHSLA